MGLCYRMKSDPPPIKKGWYTIGTRPKPFSLDAFCSPRLACQWLERLAPETTQALAAFSTTACQALLPYAHESASFLSTV